MSVCWTDWKTGNHKDLPNLCKFMMVSFGDIMSHKYVFVHATFANPWQWRLISDMIFNHRQRDCLFKCLFLLTSEKTSKLPTTGQMWGESTGYWSILFTKGRLCGNTSVSWPHLAIRSNPNLLKKAWIGKYMHIYLFRLISIQCSDINLAYAEYHT